MIIESYSCQTVNFSAISHLEKVHIELAMLILRNLDWPDLLNVARLSRRCYCIVDKMLNYKVSNPFVSPNLYSSLNWKILLLTNLHFRRSRFWHKGPLAISPIDNNVITRWMYNLTPNQMSIKVMRDMTIRYIDDAEQKIQNEKRILVMAKKGGLAIARSTKQCVSTHFFWAVKKVLTLAGVLFYVYILSLCCVYKTDRSPTCQYQNSTIDAVAYAFPPTVSKIMLLLTRDVKI